MKNADKFVVGGQVYDVLSPATFGDYMETIGSACINPDGYAENKLFLAYDDNVQKLFRATTAIAYSELLIKDTNCEPTTMAEALANALSAGGVSYDNTDSGLTASNVQDAIDEVNGDLETVNNDLSNVDTVISENSAKNLIPNNGVSQQKNGVTYVVNTDKNSKDYGTITISGERDGWTTLTIYRSSNFLPIGRYKLSGTPADGAFLMLYDHTINEEIIGVNTKATVEFEITSSNVGHEISLQTSTKLQNVEYSANVVKPMITLASQPNSDYDHYVPYAKTNRELTNDVIDLKSKKQVVGDTEFNVTTLNSWEYTGVSFTIDKTSLVSVHEAYNASGILGIGVSNRNNSDTDFMVLCNEASFASSKRVVGLLYAGTYYVLSKNSGSTGKNNVSVIVLAEYDN